MKRRTLIQGGMGMGWLELLGLSRSAQTKTPDSVTQQAAAAPSYPPGTVAQLVGANWISCMFDPGYAMEKHIAPIYDLGPEGQPPKAYKSLTGSRGDQVSRIARIDFEDKYLSELAGALSFLVTYYNREAQGYHMFMWKGVKMNGLPVIGNFIPDRTEEEARKIWRSAYLAYGETSLPALTVVSGNSGWTALETALKALPTADSKVLWLTSVDLPSFPKAQQPNEASTVLMLGHPGTDTGRRPLVYYTAPVVVPVKGIKRRDEPPRITALRQAIEQACAAAGLKPQDIGKVVTDAGRYTPQASTRLGELGGALSDLLPDFDVLKDRIDFAALLGDLGANTVNLSLLVGAYAAYRHNVPVLYVSTVDPDAGRAMLILPPPGHVPPDPYRKFKEHPNIGQWYAPWWGPRLDGRKDYSAAVD